MSRHPDDLEVLDTALSWLRAGQRVALATVVRTWGSSPRPPGSILAMNDKGAFVGSVSGGCVEASLVKDFQEDKLAGPNPILIDFGVDRQEAHRMGLPCGGRLEVLIETLDDVSTTENLLTGLKKGALIRRSVDLTSGAVSLEPGNASHEFLTTEKQLVKTFGPAWTLLLIGDGQLARHVASMAHQLDYKVTICDPREGFETVTPIEGVDFTRIMPDDAVYALKNASRSAIIALAHDPKQDDLGLSAAIESKAFFIGALGSSRSAEARNRRLASMGYTEAQIKRIHGPVGLNIGSKRPAEIAVSILAQVTAIRNGIPVNEY